MRVVSLFSGIGAHDLGLEWAGMQIVGQVEIDDYCTKILEKHWPSVKRWRDITTVSANDIRRLKPDLITGGFPCQDVSTAGKQKGIVEGERSGLWREMWRIIRDVRPDWLLIENVPALRVKGADSVLGALEAIGYTCWALVVGAIHVRAPHERRRVLIVAHSKSSRQPSRRVPVGDGAQQSRLAHISPDVGNPQGERRPRGRVSKGQDWLPSDASGAGDSMGDPASQRERESANGADPFAVGGQAWNELSDAGELAYADSYRVWVESRWSTGASGTEATFAFPSGPGEDQFSWEEPRTIEPALGGAADGSPRGLVGLRGKQLKAIGNANPPQVVAMIGRAIMHVAGQ